jgi:hypothetical protein
MHAWTGLHETSCQCHAHITAHQPHHPRFRLLHTMTILVSCALRCATGLPSRPCGAASPSVHALDCGIRPYFPRSEIQRQHTLHKIRVLRGGCGGEAMPPPQQGFPQPEGFSNTADSGVEASGSQAPDSVGERSEGLAGTDRQTPKMRDSPTNLADLSLSREGGGGGDAGVVGDAGVGDISSEWVVGE